MEMAFIEIFSLFNNAYISITYIIKIQKSTHSIKVEKE